MITAPPGPDAGEKSERWEMANRRNFGEAGGFEVLRSLLVQYSAEDARSADKDAILLNVVLLFHLTLVSRRATTDFLTCSQVRHPYAWALPSVRGHGLTACVALCGCRCRLSER